MSIKLRLALLLGFLLLGFLGAMLWLGHLEEGEKDRLLANDRETRARLLGHWLDSVGRVLPQFTVETAQSEEFARLLANPADATFQQKVREALDTFGARSLWILRADGTARVHVGATPDVPADFPLQPGEVVPLVAETPSPRFFAETAGGLIEVSIRRLTGASEWVAVARLWDDGQLKTLSALTDAEVSLRGPSELVHPAVSDARVVLHRPLADWQGRAVRVLRLEHNAGEIESSIQTDWREAQVFFVFGFMVLVAVGLALNAWVLRPLGKITQSLATDNPQPAHEAALEPHELGRVAQLVLTSFAQRESLRREIEERAKAQSALERSEGELRQNLEERARLGRDLHDGVIQSLYAAGMGLAGIRALLRHDQSEAAARLEQTRGALNETIHDVRNFIIGLEPEALRLQTFSQAVAALCEMMKTAGAFRTTLEIDEGLAGRLTLAQRVHALQIAREAISNAVRHGEASHVQVRLRMAGEFAEFEVRDNGRGFDASSTAPRGKGLQNFADRARELGGELVVDSKPGHGATVKLTFSLHHHA
jgi:signal transduction histidine kinase